MTDRTAGWIRTLWPPAVDLVGVVALFSAMSARLDAAEACSTDHETRIRVLEQCVVQATAHMEDMARDLAWMRDHWPTAAGECSGGE
jgi:hypothetical protein